MKKFNPYSAMLRIAQDALPGHAGPYKYKVSMSASGRDGKGIHRTFEVLAMNRTDAVDKAEDKWDDQVPSHLVDRGPRVNSVDGP